MYRCSIHGDGHRRRLPAGPSDAQIMAPIEQATDEAAKISRRQAERRGLADNGQTTDDVGSLRGKRKAES